jgi:hypothetical protein
VICELWNAQSRIEKATLLWHLILQTQLIIWLQKHIRRNNTMELWIYRYVDSSPCLIDRKGSKQLKLIRVVSQSCRTGHGYANVMCTGSEKREESITVGGLKGEF